VKDSEKSRNVAEQALYNRAWGKRVKKKGEVSGVTSSDPKYVLAVERNSRA